MAGPLIGLTAYCEQAHWASWQAPAVLLPASYGNHVQAAGGVPVLLPPVPGIAVAVRRLDGLVLTGGGDIDPARYGEPLHPRTARISAERDEAELAALDAALATGIPVLGICRGLQVLNVARGGTLCQHLPPEAGDIREPGTFGSHPVRVPAGGRLAAAYGVTGGEVTMEVPTSHHQAIGKLGDGLMATAWAADGVIEAVELDAADGGAHPFTVAVQWHPEAGGDERLMRAFVAAAAGSQT